MLSKIKSCFINDRLLYSRHAKDEMENEPLGEIFDHEVMETVKSGKIIAQYDKDKPYPSCLVYGRTKGNRPIHGVFAYSDLDDLVIVITVYEPSPERWIDFERRRK